MDPEIKSLVTTIGATLAGALASAAATHGLINTTQQSALTDIIISISGVVIAGLITWYKKRTASPAALIQAVNQGNNGVKVVAASVPAPAVDVPLSGPAAKPVT